MFLYVSKSYTLVFLIIWKVGNTKHTIKYYIILEILITIMACLFFAFCKPISLWEILGTQYFSLVVIRVILGTIVVKHLVRSLTQLQ